MRHTYHLAYANGVARKVDANNYACIYNSYEGDTCFIEIALGEKSVNVKALGNYVCEFGARAYLDHTFAKVSDTISFKAEEVYNYRQ